MAGDAVVSLRGQPCCSGNRLEAVTPAVVRLHVRVIYPKAADPRGKAFPNLLVLRVAVRPSPMLARVVEEGAVLPFLQGRDAVCPFGHYPVWVGSCPSRVLKRTGSIRCANRGMGGLREPQRHLEIGCQEDLASDTLRCPI